LISSLTFGNHWWALVCKTLFCCVL
jgi:hypothetical protein